VSTESSYDSVPRDSGDDNRSWKDMMVCKLSLNGTTSSGEECLRGVSYGIARTSKSECSFGGLGRTSSFSELPPTLDSTFSK
jgi:hypothetical protein